MSRKLTSRCLSGYLEIRPWCSSRSGDSTCNCRKGVIGRRASFDDDPRPRCPDRGGTPETLFLRGLGDGLTLQGLGRPWLQGLALGLVARESGSSVE